MFKCINLNMSETTGNTIICVADQIIKDKVNNGFDPGIYGPANRILVSIAYANMALLTSPLRLEVSS